MTPNISTLWAEALVNELICQGIRDFCIAPGSRSAPLALACAEAAAKAQTSSGNGSVKIRLHIHFDERGLAYFALGLARSSGRPAALITTSGTAVANLLPAVTEAHLTHVPLILLTADRPPELIGCGANQAIRQSGIFRDFTAGAWDMPVPTEEVPLRCVQETATRAVSTAVTASLPVHLNCPFREPLYPDQGDPAGENQQAALERALRIAAPAVPRFSGKPAPQEITGEPLELLSRCRLIIAGAHTTREDGQALLSLAERLGALIIPDVQSQICQDPRVLLHSDLLETEDFRILLQHAGTLLISGGHLVSGSLLRHLRTLDGTCRILLAEKHGDLLDPAFTASGLLTAAPGDLARAAAALPRGSRPGEYLAILRKTAALERAVQEELQGAESFTEAHAIRQISSSATGLLFMGNSLPIRLYGTLAGPREDPAPRILASRGASGIDGVIAAAAGAAADTTAPATLIIGDLSALHDLNSLALAKSSGLCVVIMNDHGGNIFSMLPGSSASVHLQRCFRLDHHHDFAPAAAMFGLEYRLITSAAELKAAYPPRERRGMLLECRIPGWEGSASVMERIRKHAGVLISGMNCGHS